MTTITLQSLKQQIKWKDLLPYKHHEIANELFLPVPWLLLALWAGHHIQSSLYWLPVVLIASFYFFLTGLRLAHNAFHYCIGLSKHATDVVMLVLSVFMLGSLHATQFTHLLHHRHCLKGGDIEGHVAKYSFWMALLKGPLFPLRVHKAALTQGSNRVRRWVAAELSLNLVCLSLVWGVLGIDALKLHTLLMLLAYCLSAFFAVWTVHHDCEENPLDQSRTLRSSWKNLLFYNMFYHTEHHLFPNVPTCHLPELAERLDKAGYRSHKWVF